MLHLIVKTQGQIVAQIVLVPGKEYCIGRKPSCDFVIADQQGVSREHMRISVNELGPLLEVISKYGNVFSQGAEVRQLNLADGSQFNFLNYEFFILEKSEEKSHSANTASLVTPAPAAPNAEVGGSSDYERTIIRPVQVVPHLKLVNVYNEQIDLYRLEGGDSWIAGRDLNCHILIKDSKVSRRQFEIKKVNDQYGIVDLKSVNGTMVNGGLVSTESLTFLKSGDCITVLSHNFFFELHDTQFQQKVEKIVLPVASQVPMNQTGAHYPQPYGQPGGPPAVWNQPSHYPAPMMPQGGPFMDPSYNPGHLGGENLPVTGWKGQLQNLTKQKVLDGIKQNKMRAGLVFSICLIAIYSLVSGPSNTKNSRGIANVNQQTNPLLALNEKQQTLVKQSYQLAKNYYMQGRYELARGEIAKMSELIPEYLDSAEIDRLSMEAMALQEQKRRLEVEERQKIEIEQKIQAKVVECRPVAATTPEMEALEKCLLSVLDLNPAHPEIEKLRALVDQNRIQKSMREAQQAESAALAARLRSLYQRAASAESEGDKLRALEIYNQVAQSRLPDYGDYKPQARRKIASMKSEIEQSTGRYISEADKSYKDGDLKAAILSLRKARNLDPENDDIVRKLDSISTELRKQMMVLYQEGILEESFGNVEGTEGKQGAKDKWRRILQLDVSDGEYFRKARTKLKKYGAL